MNTVSSTNTKHSPILAMVKKIHSIPANTSTSTHAIAAGEIEHLESIKLLINFCCQG